MRENRPVAADHRYSLCLIENVSRLPHCQRHRPMANSTRYLSFSNLETGRPVIAFCSLCGNRFEAHPQDSQRTDDLVLKIRAEFEVHVCDGPHAT
jgi:hypothetical protein